MAEVLEQLENVFANIIIKMEDDGKAVGDARILLYNMETLQKDIGKMMGQLQRLMSDAAEQDAPDYKFHKETYEHWGRVMSRSVRLEGDVEIFISERTAEYHRKVAAAKAAEPETNKETATTESE